MECLPLLITRKKKATLRYFLLDHREVRITFLLKLNYIQFIDRKFAILLQDSADGKKRRRDTFIIKRGELYHLVADGKIIYKFHQKQHGSLTDAVSYILHIPHSLM